MPRKTAFQGDGVIVLEPGSATLTASTTDPHATVKLPSAVQLILATIISFSTSYVLYTLGSVYTKGELAAVSRRPEEMSDLLLFPALRIAELAMGWFSGFDDYDMASFALQTRLPYYFLLTTFYSISLSTSCLALSFDILSAFLPFYLMRPRIPAHNAEAPPTKVANKGIIQSIPLTLLITVFAAAVYGVTMFVSYKTWLPTFLVANFDGVRTLEVAHESQLPVLVFTFFPLGWTAKILLFAPSTGAKTPPKGFKAEVNFDPAVASLSEHVKWNLWGWNNGTKVMMKRTVVLAAGVFLATWIKTWKTVEGSDVWGSAGWAALWAVASVVNGALLRWVGDV